MFQGSSKSKGGFGETHPLKSFPKNIFMKLSVKQETLDILKVTEIFLKNNNLKEKMKTVKFKGLGLRNL